MRAVKSKGVAMSDWVWLFQTGCGYARLGVALRLSILIRPLNIKLFNRVNEALTTYITTFKFTLKHTDEVSCNCSPEGSALQTLLKKSKHGHVPILI